MRPILPLALLLALPLAAQAQSPQSPLEDEVVIEGIGVSQNIPCEGRDIGIYGSGNRIELSGVCGAIIVHGSDHEVRLGQATALTLSGANHTVFADAVAALTVETTGHTVTATMKGEGAPAMVHVNGADQTLNLTLAGQTEIDVGGTEQVVNWELVDGAPEPRIDVGGIDNAINRIP